MSSVCGVCDSVSENISDKESPAKIKKLRRSSSFFRYWVQAHLFLLKGPELVTLSNGLVELQRI